jgi:hypothetical protein
MRRVGVTALLTVAGVLATSADAVALHRALPRCSLHHSRTLLADAQARVFNAPYPGLPEQHEVFACASGHRRYELHVEVYEEIIGPCDEGCPPAPGELALGGVMVAYPVDVEPETKYVDCYCGGWYVDVRNLRTGRILHRVVTGGSKLTPDPGPYLTPEPGGYVGVGPAVDLVVKSDGSVAWVAEIRGFDRMKRGYEVHVLDRRGSRVLASGHGIAPSSLKLVGRFLHWTEEGKPMSAPMD